VQHRSRLGIARTFQKPRLLPGAAGARQRRARRVAPCARGPRRHSACPGSAARTARCARAVELLHGVGLGHVLRRRANLLSHAEHASAEIARGLAMRPRFILLDEPAGGLTGHEIENLGHVIRTLRDGGIGVLLVEHHTDFVFRVCDRVTTLNVGRVIKHGAPDEVRTDAEVIRVYLGA
jgi:ABC-type branched-subunit amino acid transport system ATPase component